MSSSAATRYADFTSSCPRCQQIVSTIGTTSQGVFIYDLTFVQQELESVLVAAMQRHKQLVQFNDILPTKNGESSRWTQFLKLPASSSMACVQLTDGRKPRDRKAERERRRKAGGGRSPKKRRPKKDTNLVKAIKRERKQNGFMPLKMAGLSSMLSLTLPSETNGKIHPRSRSYRTVNSSSNHHAFWYDYSNYRNGNNHTSSISKPPISIPYPDQFWTRLISKEQRFVIQTDVDELVRLLNIDQQFLYNIDHDKELPTTRRRIYSDQNLLGRKKYLDPEREYSVAIKRNCQLYATFEQMLIESQQHHNHRLKRKYSAMTNNSMELDETILTLLRRDKPEFSSKFAEIQYHLGQAVYLERLALDRAQKYFKYDTLTTQLTQIDAKINDITSSIRQRKRPNDTAVILCKSNSPIAHQNGNNNNSNGADAWRKGRRQSTLRVYDELARLLGERADLEMEIATNNYPVQF